MPFLVVLTRPDLAVRPLNEGITATAFLDKPVELESGDFDDEAQARIFALLVEHKDLEAILSDERARPLLDEISALLPEGEAGYPDDTLTDKPSSFFAREYVREQVLLGLKGEIPHAIAVSIDTFDEASDKLRIAATIHVEKVGQRKIVVGTGGAVIKSLRVGAEKRISRLLGRKVKLELFVRVMPRWKETPRMLAELGYDKQSGGKP